jgi:hypothetical protein
MTTPFEHWKFSGVDFMACRFGDGYGIADGHGNYYGAWQSVRNFRAAQRTGTESAQAIGTVRSISIRADARQSPSEVAK